MTSQARADDGVTREQATEIAAIEIASRGLGRGACMAARYEELEFVTLRLYNVDLWNCWIVYAKPQIIGLPYRSVVVVDRRSGAVVFAGRVP